MRTHRLGRGLRTSAPYLWFIENEIATLPRIVKPGAICVDVGAAYGLYTWPLADLAGPTGQVHALEPQPGLATFLRTTRRLLRAGNVTVHQTGLDNAPGLGWLARPSRGPLPIPGRAFLGQHATGLGSNAEFERHHAIVTTLTSLDDFVARLGLTRLDFVKVDIEGAEGRLLDGATRTLRTLRPTVMLELEDRHLARFGTDTATVTGTMAEFGYRPRHFTGHDWAIGGPTTHRNVLFVPPIQRRSVPATARCVASPGV